MPPPAFKADAFRIHPDHDATYAALEQAANEGLKPQQGIWKRLQAARVMLDLKGDVRCFYTIDERDVIFLDIVDHETYDKWFPPKGQRRRRL